MPAPEVISAFNIFVLIFWRICHLICLQIYNSWCIHKKTTQTEFQLSNRILIVSSKTQSNTFRSTLACFLRILTENNSSSSVFYSRNFSYILAFILRLNELNKGAFKYILFFSPFLSQRKLHFCFVNLINNCKFCVVSVL